MNPSPKPLKQFERDMLLQRQIETGERNLILLDRQAEAVEDQAQALRDLAKLFSAPERRQRKTEANAANPPLRPLFASQRGAATLLRSIPGFADLWRRHVPAKYLENILDRSGKEWWLISCPCNERPLVQAGGLAECECSRWFFATEKTVRVRRFPVSCEDE